MNQAEPSPAAQKPASTLKLIAVVAFRILGYRQKKFNEAEFQQLTGMQAGIACILALVGFCAVIGVISVLAVKAMG